MTILARFLLASFLLVGLLLGKAQAQTQPASPPVVKIDKRKLLVQPRNADGSLVMVSFMEDPVLWVSEKQQEFYGALAGGLRRIRSNGESTAAWTLMLLSFGYGIFHAAGPGHGKTVISAWLLATENELKRGMLIAFLSSIIQALSAIAIVSALLLIVGTASRAARDIASSLESASFAMIAALGLYLLWTALRQVVRKASTHTSHEHHHDHEQNHHHVHDEHCGHHHAPEAQDVKGPWSLAKALSLSFAIGIRPCTGAILVLILANTLGIYWAGIASTLVMGMGTFLTVAVIATIAVYSKKLAVGLAARDGRWLGIVAFALRAGGGLAIACIGSLLFLGSLNHSAGMM